MTRPLNPRCVRFFPKCRYFKPAGVPLREIQEVELKEDELEAVRLVDYRGLYREEAAKKMKVSRQTLDRILHSARKKIAKALIGGKALKICERNKKKERENNMNKNIVTDQESGVISKVFGMGRRLRFGRGGGQGQGRGRGRGRCERMSGGVAVTGACVCPECGHQELHQRGNPCFQKKCPKCGEAMVRGE